MRKKELFGSKRKAGRIVGLVCIPGSCSQPSERMRTGENPTDIW